MKALGVLCLLLLSATFANANTSLQSRSGLEEGAMEKRLTGSGSLNYEGFNQAENTAPKAPLYNGAGGALSARYKASDKHAYSVSTSSTGYAFENVSQEFMPAGRFWQNSVGTTYHRVISERSSYDLSLSVNSSSDRYVGKAYDLSYGVSWVYSRAASGMNRWTYGAGLGYSGNNTFTPPIPFASYYYYINETWQIRAGLPLGVDFVPTSKLSFNLTYVPVKAVTAQGDYKVTKANKVYLGYALSSVKSFRQSDRENKKESIYFDESKYFLGLSSESLKPAVLGVSLAYVYNRDLWKADKISNDRPKLTGLPNEWRAMTTATFPIL